MGAADSDEARAVEAHLRVCGACRALADEYRQLGDDLLFAAPTIVAPVGMTEDLRKKLNAGSKPAPRKAGWLDFLRRPAVALGAAALALLILTNVYWAGRVGALERQAIDLAALTKAPGISLQVSDTSLHADGVVYVQPDSRKALLCVYALPALEPGKTYQAWLVREGKRVSAGTFDVNEDGYGALLIESEEPVSGFQQLGITVEPDGGSAAPTSPRVMGGNL
jgi:anti-sigma-K factor RskA